MNEALEMYKAQDQYRTSTMQFASERSSNVLEESTVLEFVPGQDESFHLKQRQMDQRRTSCVQMKLHENFLYNVAVMGESRRENTSFI